MSDLLFNISEIQLKYDPNVKPISRTKITTSDDAYRQFVQLFDHSLMNIKEEAVALFLNRSNRLLGGYKISSGGISGTIVDVRLLMGIAIKSLASGIILAHTHPSGELLPSNSDKE